MSFCMSFLLFWGINYDMAMQPSGSVLNVSLMIVRASPSFSASASCQSSIDSNSTGLKSCLGMITTMFCHTKHPPQRDSYILIISIRAAFASLSPDSIRANMSIKGIFFRPKAISSRIFWSRPAESDRPGQSIKVSFPFPSNQLSPDLYSILDVTD